MAGCDEIQHVLEEHARPSGDLGRVPAGHRSDHRLDVIVDVARPGEDADERGKDQEEREQVETARPQHRVEQRRVALGHQTVELGERHLRVGSPKPTPTTRTTSPPTWPTRRCRTGETRSGESIQRAYLRDEVRYVAVRTGGRDALHAGDPNTVVEHVFKEPG